MQQTYSFVGGQDSGALHLLSLKSRACHKVCVLRMFWIVLVCTFLDQLELARELEATLQQNIDLPVKNFACNGVGSLLTKT